VSEALIYAWECGRRTPRIQDLPKLANGLRVSIRTLLPAK
jgi:transcriptional regulator with XRE-family HTH domain